ncbi:MAG: dTDP-4-amino-4,6-dideoxygalactose transaminase [Parvibaculum sp.]
MNKIPFIRPHLTGREMELIGQCLSSGQMVGDGPFTKQCEAHLREHTGARQALLTHSCTAALELSALLLDLAPGDEVIMPTYTFVSTANAFVLRGAVPVFVDVRADTINLDEKLIETAITPRTRAIVPVHYAGVACAMDEINAIAAAHKLHVVEDAAQGVGATYRGQALGTLGSLGALSFHATKNVISGEGGALLINDENLVERAEVIREKGTDRSRFIRGEVDKYTWQDIGSSFLPSDITAAMLMAQLPETNSINAKRLAIWSRFHAAFADAERAGRFRRPGLPQDCGSNAHIYYIVFNSQDERESARAKLADAGIAAVTHYVPLHLSPGAARFGRNSGEMPVAMSVADGLLRLPIYPDLAAEEEARIVDAVLAL